MLNGVFKRLQHHSTFLIENKGYVVWMLNENLSRFKFNSIRIQQAFNNVVRPVCGKKQILARASGIYREK